MYTPSLNLETFHVQACNNPHAPHLQSLSRQHKVTSDGQCSSVRGAADIGFHRWEEKAHEAQGKSIKDVVFVRCYLYWGSICTDVAAFESSLFL